MLNIVWVHSNSIDQTSEINYKEAIEVVAKVIESCFWVTSEVSSFDPNNEHSQITLKFRSESPMSQRTIRELMLHSARELQLNFARIPAHKNETLDLNRVHCLLKIEGTNQKRFLQSEKESEQESSAYCHASFEYGKLKYYTKKEFGFGKKLASEESWQKAFSLIGGDAKYLIKAKTVPAFPKDNRVLVQTFVAKARLFIAKKYHLKFQSYSIRCPQKIEKINLNFETPGAMTQNEGRLLIVSCLNDLMSHLKEYDEIQPQLVKGFNENNVAIELRSTLSPKETYYKEAYNISIVNGMVTYNKVQQDRLCHLEPIQKESLQEAISLVDRAWQNNH